MHDESEFTPWAEPGWTAWNSYSPEVEFCQFIANVQKLIQPETVIETGVGAGKVTQFLDLDACTYLGFESEPEWRRRPAMRDAATPTEAQMSSADLVILDSAPGYRIDEIALWGAAGKPGSLSIVHDCGNNHPPTWMNHHRYRAAVEALHIKGVWLKNPRGGWMGVHP